LETKCHVQQTAFSDSGIFQDVCAGATYGIRIANVFCIQFSPKEQIEQIKYLAKPKNMKILIEKGFISGMSIRFVMAIPH
jgi:hypothetical protein